jgi:hypothetical protein
MNHFLANIGKNGEGGGVVGLDICTIHLPIGNPVLLKQVYSLIFLI